MATFSAPAAHAQYVPEGAITRHSAYLDAARCAVMIGMLLQIEPADSGARPQLEAIRDAWTQSGLKIDPDPDKFQSQARTQWGFLTGRAFTDLKFEDSEMNAEDPLSRSERAAMLQRTANECQQQPPPTPTEFPLPSDPAQNRYYTMLRCEVLLEFEGGHRADDDPEQSRALLVDAAKFHAAALAAFPGLTATRLEADMQGERELYFDMYDAGQLWWQRCAKLRKEL